MTKKRNDERTYLEFVHDAGNDQLGPCEPGDTFNISGYRTAGDGGACVYQVVEGRSEESQDVDLRNGKVDQLVWIPKQKKKKKKKIKNQRKSKRSHLDKSIHKCLKGFWLKFDMVDPLGDHENPINATVGSHNPYVDVRLTSVLFWDAMRHVLHYKRLKWRMEVRMEFERKDGGSEFKQVEIVAVGALPDIDDHYQEVIEKMFQEAQDKNYINRYRRTYVTQEVISGQIIKDEDFTE